jgi:hypothetical protein
MTREGGRALLMTAAAVAVCLADAAAQTTYMPTFNAPYRAFTRSEFGALMSFPDPGGIALEGAYRLASRRFDIGIRGGFYDPEEGDEVFLVGVEGRQRVITHNVDFPLDGALIVGLGAMFNDNASVVNIPVGLSLGRRLTLEGSKVSIVPYVQPTLFIRAGDVGDDNVNFALGIGADFRFTPRFDGRLSAGLGDLEGVSLGFVWVH